MTFARIVMVVIALELKFSRRFWSAQSHTGETGTPAFYKSRIIDLRDVCMDHNSIATDVIAAETEDQLSELGIFGGHIVECSRSNSKRFARARNRHRW